jgi:uncharacterized membrane protein HdeD (DUF308 family)
MIIFSTGRNFRSESKLTGGIKALFAIALGVSLIVTKANAMTLVVQAVSVGIMALGIVPLILSMKYPAMQELASGSFFRILISVLLFTFAGPVAAVIRYIIGGILCLVGMSQIMNFFSMSKASAEGYMPFVIPVLLLAGGVMFFSEELIGNDIMGLIAGIAFILYGVNKGWSVLKKDKDPENHNQYYFEDDTVDEQ